MPESSAPEFPAPEETPSNTETSADETVFLGKENPPPDSESSASDPFEPYAVRYGLIRPLQGRTLAGVCAAIGRVTGTDPLLWRVLLAVLTMAGGIGLVAYFVVWAVTPSEGDSASPLEAMLGRGESDSSPVIVLVLGAIVVLTVAFAFADSHNPALVGVAAIFGAAYLGTRKGRTRPQIGNEPTAEPTGTGFGGAGLGRPASGGVRDSAPPLSPGGPFSGISPYARSIGYKYLAGPDGEVKVQPAYPGLSGTSFSGITYPVGKPGQPMGAATLPRRRRERSVLGRLTASLVLIALGVVYLVDSLGARVPGQVYAGTALAVVAVGLLVGSWFGRARWLIPVGMMLSMSLAGSAAVNVNMNIDAADRNWTVNRIEDLNSNYSLDLGKAVLDLHQLDFAGQERTVNLKLKAGEMQVLLPSKVEVEVHATVKAGEATVFQETWNGLNSTERVVRDPGSEGGGHLRLNIVINFGNLVVTR